MTSWRFEVQGGNRLDVRPSLHGPLVLSDQPLCKQLGDPLLKRVREVDAGRACGMKECPQILRNTKVSGRPRPAGRRRLCGPSLDDSAEVFDQTLWVIRIWPVADPPVAQRLAALRAPIITGGANIGAIAGPRTRVYMIHA